MLSDELLATAEAEAAKGYASFSAWWETVSEDDGAALTPRLKELTKEGSPDRDCRDGGHPVIEQGTDAWRLQRCGLATASRFADVMATVKTGESADRRNYPRSFVRATYRKARRTYSNRAMLVGTEREPDARALYQVRTRRLDEAGFVRIEGMAAGASPDGLIGDDGLLEIKCPNWRRTSTILPCRSASAQRRTSGRYRGRCSPLAGHGAISCRITRSSRRVANRHSPRAARPASAGKTGNGARQVPRRS